MTADTGLPTAPPRRTVLQAAALGLVAGTGALVAACSPPPDATPDSGDPASSATPGTTLGAASDVPVGGGTIYSAQKVVVTQPTAGEFHGFSAVCTHQGCTVASVEDGQIACPCHGSHYSITDGSVVSGPAPRSLPTVEVTVSGGEVVVA